MCCVWNCMCKIISFVITVITLVLVILLILWLAKVFESDDNDVTPTTVATSYLKSAGEYKYAAVGASFT